jgi:PAS domain S-box-containing protein
MRTIKFFIVFSLLLSSFPVHWSAATDLPKRVLLLDSYGRNVAPVSTVISVFRTELSSRSPEPIDLHEISLEMARFAQPEEELPFVNFLRERFSGHNPIMVVSVGGPAFNFVVRHRNNLFPASPLLIAGVANQVLHSELVPNNAAVIPLRVNLRGIIEDILQVLPDTESIAVILGSSALEKFWIDECRREFADFSSRINFTYLNDKPFEEMKRRVATLPPKSAVFFGLLVVDAAGTLFDPAEAIKVIIAEANSPVFALHESFFGLGTVGGRLIQERAGGLRATEVGLQILKGESPGSIPIPPEPAEVAVYDWRALKRWGINENNLPKDSTVHFRQPSLWELYHWRIFGLAALLICQAVLIAGLLLQRRRRNRAERELLKSEKRLRQITNALPVLIAYVDSDQLYRFNNDAYKEWFGISPEEAWGRPIREVVGEEFYHRVRPYVERALSGEQIRYFHDIDLEGGRHIWVEAIYIPDADEQGTISGFYVLVMDVTERNLAQQESKQLQDELLHAGRISTMGELAGALAHEINQPLSAIMSNAQAAKRYLNAPTPDMEEIKEILNDIIKEDARAGEVINRLRGLLKKGKTEFESLDLNLIFKEVVGLLHSDAVIRDFEIDLELDPLLPLVRGDRIQLQQVALNLMLNSFEATAEQPREGRRVLIRTCQNDSEVLAAVADHGKGIRASEIEKVFNPFYTTKPQGLGMGLSISRSIISRHQGRIWVENNPGGGTTFYFSLRAATDEQVLS